LPGAAPVALPGILVVPTVPVARAQIEQRVSDGGDVTPIQLVSETQVEVTGGLHEGQLVATYNTAGLNSGDVVVPQVDTRTALAR
jgi:hypothetical protein